MKIRIIGPSGSGKTYLAKKLAKKYNIPNYDLDELFWNNSDGYGNRRDAKERDGLLENLLKKDDWIIEGVYYEWCMSTFDAADKIYITDTPQYKCRWRIMRRFIRRKLGLSVGRHETVRSLIALIKWTKKYAKEDLPKIKKMLEGKENAETVR